MAGWWTTNGVVEAVNKLLANDYLILLTRVFLGLLFIVYSIDKIVDANAFAESIGNYKILGGSTALVFATVLPWMELLAGLCILFGLFLRGSSLLVTFLLAVFTAAVISALARGLDISCGCFTLDPETHKVGWLKVSQNAGLFVLGIYLYFSCGIRFSLERYIRSHPPEQ